MFIFIFIYQNQIYSLNAFKLTRHVILITIEHILNHKNLNINVN